MRRTGWINPAKPLDPLGMPAYTAPFPVGLLIPGVGLRNHLEHESTFVGAALTRQAGQPQQKTMTHLWRAGNWTR